MSKINIHIHFIQFDNQASDGVITGASYEQSIRPFTQMGKKKHKGLPTPMNAVLTEDTKAGATSIKIKMADGATLSTSEPICWSAWMRSTPEKSAGSNRSRAIR